MEDQHRNGAFMSEPLNLQPFFVQHKVPTTKYFPQLANAQPPVTMFPYIATPYSPKDPFGADEFLVRSTDITSTAVKAVRNIGDFGNFLRMLILGFFCPIIGGIIVFALETTHLAKYGVTIGTANSLLWFGTYFISLGVVYHKWEFSSLLHSGQIFLWVAIALLIGSIVLYLFSYSLWKKLMILYRSDMAEELRMKVSSPLGSKYQAVSAFGISVLLPILGSALVLFCSRTLHSRKGALMGLASSVVLIGLACVPWSIGYVTGNAGLMAGIVLMQCTYVHFERAIASAELEGFAGIEFE